MGRLDGKVAIVTGATRGIGRAIALMFAREGARVAVTGRHPERGAAVVDEICAAGGVATFFPGELGAEDDVRRVVDAAAERFGRITTLVNNAAATDRVGPGRGDARLVDVDNSAWEAVLAVGLHGLFWSCKHAIPHMIEAGGGSIINISAHAGVRGVSGFAAYTASKGAMNALTRALAVEHGADHIRCNAISAGFIQSGPWVDEQLTDERALARLQRAYLTRLGVPDDVAYAAVYLASDEAEIVTGVVLPVDGGLQAK